MKTILLITHSLDEDGVTPLVSVPLTNCDKNVILYQSDFNSLYEMGVNPLWRLSNGQVFERGRQRLIISRLIVDAQSGDKVQILDKDPCNLRRSNLLLSVGSRKSKTAADRLSAKDRPHRFG